MSPYKFKRNDSNSSKQQMWKLSVLFGLKHYILIFSFLVFSCSIFNFQRVSITYLILTWLLDSLHLKFRIAKMKEDIKSECFNNSAWVYDSLQPVSVESSADFQQALTTWSSAQCASQIYSLYLCLFYLLETLKLEP